MSSSVTTAISGDVGKQLTSLKGKLDQGIERQVEPLLNEAQDVIGDRAKKLLGQIRSRPLTALAVTALLAFIVGRITRSKR